MATDGHLASGRQSPVMSELTADEFEEQKYVDYFPKLETAYKRAFDDVNGKYDRDLIHAIDQMVLSESEPFYEDGEFSVELPDDPLSRIEGVDFEKEYGERALDEHVKRIRVHLRDQFGVGDVGDEKA